MVLTELPLDLVSHIALWLPDARTLARMEWASKLCRHACQLQAEKMRRLLKHSARMPALLRCPEYHCPRPLDYEELLRQQQGTENGESAQLHSRSKTLQLPADVFFSVEVLYGDASWAWCGPPRELIPDLTDPTRVLSARVWEERPDFIDELNRLNNVDRDGAHTLWQTVRIRAFVTRGLRSIKIYDGNLDDSDGEKHSYASFMEVGEVGSFVTSAYGPPQMITFEARMSMTDDGEIDLCFFAFTDDDDCDVSGEDVLQLLNAAARAPSPAGPLL